MVCRAPAKKVRQKKESKILMIMKRGDKKKVPKLKRHIERNRIIIFDSHIISFK
jgi:hypothetical protein